MRVGLVGCGRRKGPDAAPARDLYTGALFRAAGAYAEATYDSWFVLSALHGLVEPDRVLSPYELPMTELRQAERDAWGGRAASALQSRLRALGLSVPSVPRGQPWPHEPQVQVFIHAGKDYVRALWFGLGLYPCDVVLPVEGLGIGQQLAWYTERRGAG